jgi:hypothetical protein
VRAHLRRFVRGAVGTQGFTRYAGRHHPGSRQHGRSGSKWSSN